jgi:hypothetical protein
MIALRFGKNRNIGCLDGTWSVLARGIRTNKCQHLCQMGAGWNFSVPQQCVRVVPQLFCRLWKFVAFLRLRGFALFFQTRLPVEHHRHGERFFAASTGTYQKALTVIGDRKAAALPRQGNGKQRLWSARLKGGA